VHDLVVVLPVRGLASGKSRLEAVLAPAARAELNEWLLDRTLLTLRSWLGSVDSCVVVSACERVLHIAGSNASDIVRETRVAGLNAAAALGLQRAVERGASKVLVLPCDLPHLTVHALQALARDANRGDVVIAPDRSGTGTNALLVPAQLTPDFRFGDDSFALHLAAAAAAGAGVVVHRSPEIAFDLDTAEDYALWSSTTGRSAATPMV
jgi:2-phospho-L-lactate guanylyltransferase